MTRTALSFVGGFVLGVLAIWVYDAAFVDDSLTKLPELDEAAQESAGSSASAPTIIATAPPTETATSQIVVRDQEQGTAVSIDAVSLDVDGWIVIHEENAGVFGNALGALRRAAGSHEDLVVPLLRETLSGQRYFVVIYADNGDQEFSLTTDFPAKGEDNQIVTAAFFAQ